MKSNVIRIISEIAVAVFNTLFGEMFAANAHVLGVKARHSGSSTEQKY